jgi:hypothetical protein
LYLATMTTIVLATIVLSAGTLLCKADRFSLAKYLISYF